MSDIENRCRAARGRRASVAAPLTCFIILYVVGMASDSWYVVHRSDFFNKFVANVGLFKACGYHGNLTLVDQDIGNPSFTPGPQECISLVQAAVPGWMRAVQVLCILCLSLMCVIMALWTYLICVSGLDNTRVMYPLVATWITTGLMLLLEVILFACHLRPGRQEFESTSFLKSDIVVKRVYWTGFILHCVVAGGINAISLIAVCCVLCHCFR